jgi:predicted transcriptional regulator
MSSVREVMAKEVISVAVDDTAASAADLMTVLAISGVPVRDKDGVFVGVLSKSDLANHRLAGAVRHPLVADLMTPDVLAIYADDPALSAVVAMAKHDIHRVFVVDRPRHLVGVVTALDIVKAIARGEQFDIEAAIGLDLETTSGLGPRMPDEAGRG